MLEEQVLEERYPYLNEDKYLRMEYSRVYQWRDVAEDGKYKSKIRSLWWYFYTRDKQELIKRQFLVSVPHPKGGEGCTCVKDDTIEEKEKYDANVLRGFDYKLFEEEQGRGIRELLYGYLYLKHIIQLWLGYWFNQMAKMNLQVAKENRLGNYGWKNGVGS